MSTVNDAGKIITRAWVQSASHGQVNGDKFAGKVAAELARAPGDVVKEVFTQLRGDKYEPYNDAVALKLAERIGEDGMNELPLEARGAIVQTLREEKPSPKIMAEYQTWLKGALGHEPPNQEVLKGSVIVATAMREQGRAPENVGAMMTPLFELMKASEAPEGNAILMKSLPKDADRALYQKLEEKFFADQRLDADAKLKDPAYRAARRQEVLADANT
jgi:hypothetical protein